MKKGSILLFCIIALVAFAAWAPNVEAYSNYGGGCQNCHGGFLALNYQSNTAQDGVAWNTSLHSGHQGFAGCTACHQQIGDNPLIAGPSGDGFNSCMGCHGRDEDANNLGVGPGRGAGLRQHHWVNNITTTCSGCHPDSNPAAFTPVGEDIPGARNAALGIDPCNDVVFGVFGSDNDGDNLYDGDDPDCGPPPECTVDADCDDGVTCTDDTCVAGVCVYTPDDTVCDDGLLCNGLETCDAQLDCQDGTPACDPATEDCIEGDPPTCVPIGGEPVEVRVRVAKSINPKNNGVTPVRFFARGMDLEIAEVECGRGEAEPVRLIHRDANDDGYVDVLAKFRTRALDIQCGDTTIMCEGTLTDGTEFMGTSNMFKTVGGYCKDKDKDKDEGKDKGKDKGK